LSQARMIRRPTALPRSPRLIRSRQRSDDKPGNFYDARPIVWSANWMALGGRRRRVERCLNWGSRRPPNITGTRGTLHPPGLLSTDPQRSGIATSHSQQPQMIKSLTALAIFALLGAAVIALPGFAPDVRASEPVALAKADRLAIHPVVRTCASQVWPNFDATCLRDGSGVLVREARLVTARR
jgi:hypothetical protein